MNNQESGEWFENKHDTPPRNGELVKVKLGDDGIRELYAMYAPFDTASVLWFSVHGPIDYGPVKKWRHIPILETQEWQPKFDEAIEQWLAGSALLELKAAGWRLPPAE